MTDPKPIPGWPDHQQIPHWIDTVGPGWGPLLDELHRQLLDLDADYRIETFRTHLGGLRIAVADRFTPGDGDFDGAWTDAATQLTDAAELAAERTCERCGRRGTQRFRGEGRRIWIKTLCEDCRHAPEPDGPGARARTTLTSLGTGTA